MRDGEKSGGQKMWALVQRQCSGSPLVAKFKQASLNGWLFWRASCTF